MQVFSCKFYETFQSSYFTDHFTEHPGSRTTISQKTSVSSCFWWTFLVWLQDLSVTYIPKLLTWISPRYEPFWKLVKLNVAKFQTLCQKEVVLFPDIGRVKCFLFSTRPHSRLCSRTYIFNFKRQTNKQKNPWIQKQQKKLKKKIEYLWYLKSIQKINLRPPVWRFYSSPAFPETRVFFWPCYNIFT